MDVKTFKTLFVHRDDVYATQRPNGSYQPYKETLDDENIQAHLDGTQTVGLYQVMPEVNTVKWGVLDIDIKKEIYSAPGFKIEDWLSKLMQQAEIAKERFNQHGIPSYIEFSGFKGYHVWAFFETPVDAGTVKKGMETIFDDMTPVDAGLAWEIFPKQAKLSKEGLGNLVKGASGYHHKAKKFSEFVKPLTLDAVEFANIADFAKVNAAYMHILNKCSATKNMWDTCLEQGNAPNFAREAFAYLFLNVEGGRDFLEHTFLSKLDNYDAKTTKYHLDRMEDKVRDDSKQTGYIPITCEAMQDDKYGKMCPKKCDAIVFAKSPIAFYHWATSEDEADLTAINKMDFLFKSGNCYYERVGLSKDGTPSIKQISSFTIDLKEHLTIRDGLVTLNKEKGIISKDGFSREFDLETDTYSADDKLRASIYGILGPNQLLIDNITKVRDAVNKYSSTKNIDILKRFGYNELEDNAMLPDRFRSQDVIVTKEGPRKNDEIKVDLSDEEFAKDLNLKLVSDEEFRNLKLHIQEDLLKLANPDVTYSALAFTLLPIIFPFLDEDRTKFSLFVRGESGKGKSFILLAFQNFFGNFEKVTTWSSTTNALGRIGYFFNDSLYLIDDFKRRVFNNKGGGSYDAALTLLQNYADNTARARMTATLGTAPTYVIRGWVACTGEDTPNNEASNLARMVPITHRSLERDMVRGDRVKEMKHMYSAFTARYIHKIFNISPILFRKTMKEEMNMYFTEIKGQSNDVRIARNIALLATSFKYASEFLWTKKEAKIHQEEYKTILMNKVGKVVVEATGELASERFVDAVKEMLAIGKLRLQSNYQTDVDESNAPVIGYWGKVRGEKSEVPHIIMLIAYNEVQRYLRASNEGLSHTRKAVSSQLYENGLVFDAKDHPRSFNGRNVRVIRFKPGVLE